MTEVEELAARIRSLPRDRLAELRDWFHEFEREVWDRQIQADLKAGKFASLIDEARKEFAEGKARALKHFTSSKFWSLYEDLPAEVRELADKNYQLLKAKPHHPSLQLKRIDELWSVRVGQHYRALGIDVRGGIQWIWIGSHADYDKFFA